jgi:hypothetical protein
MRWAVIDTNVFIGHWENGLYFELLAQETRVRLHLL